VTNDQLIRHAIQKAIMVSVGLMSSARGKVLAALVNDPALLERAVGLITNQMLRELDPTESLRPAHFQRLLDEIEALSNES